jgi:hypothetical protein
MFPMGVLMCKHLFMCVFLLGSIIFCNQSNIVVWVKVLFNFNITCQNYLKIIVNILYILSGSIFELCKLLEF